MRSAASLLPALLLSACAGMDHRDAAASIEQIERARFAAMVARDVRALDPMLASDLHYCHSTGQVENEAQFLETIRTQRLRYDAIDLKEINVRHSGDLALVTGLANVRVAVGSDSQQFDLRYTDAYVLRDGRWQLVAWQSTRVP